ncbi:MAG: monofunctional biosynthetic peptidoglycan transglycosylase [Bacteroidetes bacterium]|nr:monofunctional biosynthetic peptidoglycan transglycosylase [Bacteroidota bacterium]
MPAITGLFAKIFVWSFIWKWIKRIVIGFFILSIASVLLFSIPGLPTPYNFLMYQRCIEQKMDGQTVKLYRDWVDIDQISEYVPLAVVCAEDQNYLKHNGFDYGAIQKAIKYNEKMEKKGKSKRRGASTISQQTAKNVFLWPGRSWIRKGFEVYFTFLIEIIWSKERIMEVYLNNIELGNGVYGVEAAAHDYLNKSAKKLSAKYAALMAVVFPNPRKFSIQNTSPYIRKRQAWCYQQMKFWGMHLDFDKED